jgi:hypothetical protein
VSGDGDAVTRAKYTGNGKVGGSIHGGGEFIQVDFSGDSFRESLSHGLANIYLQRVSTIRLFTEFDLPSISKAIYVYC